VTPFLRSATGSGDKHPASCAVAVSLTARAKLCEVDH